MAKKMVAGTTAERNLIEGIKRGDEQAFAAMYRSYQPRIYHLCLRFLRNAADAEDLCQEAFLRLHQKIHTFRGEAAFSTWFYRLVTNLALMRLRRRKLSEVALDAPFRSADGDIVVPEDHLAIDDKDLIGIASRMDLEVALGDLHPGHRVHFVLRHIDGLSYEEIAEIRGISVGGAKSQCSRACSRLRERLRHYQGARTSGTT
jgi:RNA polymerase sigma-70 factor (ECF subfamily)